MLDKIVIFLLHITGIVWLVSFLFSLNDPQYHLLTNGMLFFLCAHMIEVNGRVSRLFRVEDDT